MDHLVDTCALLLFLEGDPRLPEAAAEKLAALPLALSGSQVEAQLAVSDVATAPATPIRSTPSCW